MTREAWLQRAVELVDPLFADVGINVPPVHVSVGWPSKGGLSKKRTIGQCWAADVSADGVSHVFISPVLGDPVEVLAVLVHELVHATVGCEHGHGKEFGTPARAVGLEGKLTATHAGEALRVELVRISTELGDYPHSPISYERDAAAVQTTRMLKVQAACCGYVVRTTRKWLDEGLPSCPCGNRMEEA